MFDELIIQLKKLRAAKEQIEQQIEDVRTEWGDRVLMNGKYESEAGRIEIRSSSFRVSYDSKVVDAVKNALLEVNPALAQQLEDARKVTTVQATWAVR